ncbi:MAG TPA: hypothetical protein VFX55_08930 [Duganella sp.]|nr:hypothetical protein [Duganella sp.]
MAESALPLRHGFLSLLARGADAQFVMDSVHDLQAHLWSGALLQHPVAGIQPGYLSQPRWRK